MSIVKHGFGTSKGVVVEFKDDSLVMNSQRPDSVTITDEELHLLGVPDVPQYNDAMRITLNQRQELPANNPEIDENGDKELAELGIPSLAECRKELKIGLTINQSEGQTKDLKDIPDDLQTNSDDEITQLTGLTLDETRKAMGLKL